jgi:glycosyltransferase involved in cell wall biosynthesis
VSIRVLTVVPTLMCGGTENQALALGNGLDPGRLEIEFACLRRRGPFVEELEARRIPLTEYRITSFFSLGALAQQARLARRIAARRIQIVHAYNFYGNVFAVPPARLVAPVVIASIRDCAPYLTTMQRRVQRWACRLADCVLVNADAVRDWLIADGYDESRIVLVPNGVDLSRFDNLPDRRRLRHELGLAPDTPLVGVVSRLTPLKGIEQFLEAAGALSRTHPTVRFLVVGETAPTEGAYLEALRALARRYGLDGPLIFTGRRSDVPAVLSSLDVSVMPSLNEALSNVVLESMAAAAPTVATRVGGTPEAVVDGVSGLLVPPGDAGALARAIATLLDDPVRAAALGRTARQTIVERFSVDRMVRATEAVYLDLLERKLRGLVPASA